MSDDKIRSAPTALATPFSTAPPRVSRLSHACPANHPYGLSDGAMPGADPPTTETVKHTVVKTKTKKAPVFLASFGGLVVGAVLVIALVMSGAFR